MKKLTLVILVCVGAIAILASKNPVKAELTETISSECFLENVRAWVVTDIPGQPTGYEAYFASESTANLFISFYGGGTISDTNACKPYDQVIRHISDPCTPCS